MEETSISLLTNCKLTICDKISLDDKNLNAFLLDTLHFKICSVDPLVIEKDCPSPDDIHRVLDALKASLHSQNRKDDILVDHHRDLIDLEQKKGNATCDSLMHTSSLEAVDGNRQSKEHSVESNCDDNCFNEASSQIQGSYDAEQDLINTFQSLTVTDECTELTRKNTEKFSSNIQEVENTQTKLTAAQRNNSAQVINMTREANKLLYTEEKNKNCESISTEKLCRTATEHVKCNEDAEHTNRKINEAQNLTTQENLSQWVETAIERQHMVKYEDAKINNDFNIPMHGEKTENISRQENLRQSAQNVIERQHVVKSEDAKINKDLNIPKHGEKTENTSRQESLGHYTENAIERQHMVKSEDAQIKKDLNIPMHGEDKSENISRQENLSQFAENAIKRQHMVKSEDAEINKDLNVSMHGEDKTENHNLISSDSACTTAAATKESLYCKMNAGDNKLNHAPYLAVRNGGTEKQGLEEEKNKKAKVISREVTFKQNVETEKGEVHLSSSTENVHQPPDYDITKQELSNKISQLETSEISSKSHPLNDNTESSDSDSESQRSLTGSIKASSLDGVKMHFKKSVYDKYFDEAKNEGMGFIFRLNSSDKNAVSFIKKLNKLKVEEFEFDDKERKYLEAAVQYIKDQINGLEIQVSDGKVVIVGLKDSVTSAKKKLTAWLQNHRDLATNCLEKIKSNESRATEGGLLNMNSPITQKSQEASRNKISDKEKTHELMIRSQESEFNETHQKEPQSRTFPYDSPSQSFTLPVKTDYYGYSEHNMFSKDKNNYYAKNERSALKVKIYKTDITKLEVNCIVNAANKRLQHGGGVAKAISLAAGPALNKECEAFINSGNQVAVTDIFLSTGGNLPAKCVMHAVGPKWDAYDDKRKPECFDDLRHTVIRCLVEAGRQGFTSIALPSISAAIFKVPKEACARCYMEAVKHFAIFNEEQTSLLEIHFVDVDDTMVKVIQEHFEKNWTSPCNPHLVQKDCDFARSHIYSATRNAAKHFEKSPDASKTTSSSSAKTPGVNKPLSVPGSRLSAGSTVSSTSRERREESFAYQIGSFTLNTDTRPAFDIFSDITITVGQPFDKLSGFPKFSVSDNKQTKESVKNIYTLYNVSTTKSHHQKQLCALFPEPDCKERIKGALGNLDIILQSPNHKTFTQNISKVVLTSSILYKEPDNVQNKNQHFYDRKKPGQFAKCLFDYLNHSSEVSSISITVVGCEDAIQSFHKVMESRGVRKISREAQQGARSKTTEGSHYRSEGGYSTQHSGYAAQGRDYSRQHHDEAQQGARSKTNEGSHYHSEGGYSTQHSGCGAKGSDYSRQHRGEDAGSSVDLDKTTCEICACKKLCVSLKCCGNYMCQGCQQKVTICPYCRKFWRVSIGDQPPGTMSVCVLSLSVAGYEHFHTWQITYFFPPGQQKVCHPNPGQYYTGMSRTAYLPATDEGFRVLKLLRLAFLRKLTFTIGRSLTMGRENSIVWNDIHHKTNLSGGMYGYPDPNYLHNVYGELASKGVTFDTVSVDEIRKIKDFEYHISTFGYFTDIFPE